MLRIKVTLGHFKVAFWIDTYDVLSIVFFYILQYGLSVMMEHCYAVKRWR